MPSHLIIAVHIHGDGCGMARFHGMNERGPEWPPSPARVFQALLSGVAQGQGLEEKWQSALEWLEKLPAPTLAAPRRRLASAFTTYVLNNDTDTLLDPFDRDKSEAARKMRAPKVIEPCLFPASVPVVYAWPIDDPDSTHIRVVEEAVHHLYQLGRSLDMAWANAWVVSSEALTDLLHRFPGEVLEPGPATGQTQQLACPTPGSLRSLSTRFQSVRFRTRLVEEKQQTLYLNPPKPRFSAQPYAPARHTFLYDLKARGSAAFWPWKARSIVRLVERLRDAAALRLKTAMSDTAELVERHLIGRSQEATGLRTNERIQLIPLPSIGSEHADGAIRRLLVQVPGTCGLLAADVDWAFSGLDWCDPDTGELSDLVCTRAVDSEMRNRYSAGARHWHSITPVALPIRHDPDSGQDGVKDRSGASRLLVAQAQAARAVAVALRHAGIRALPLSIEVRKYPFLKNGTSTDDYAQGTRFSSEQLWHVRIEFEEFLTGPLIIGNGRFLGLGLMAPARVPANQFGIFSLHAKMPPQSEPSDPIALARALRRAVMSCMARFQPNPDEPLNPYVSGHGKQPGERDQSDEGHLAFHWDAPSSRWLIIAPQRLRSASATSASSTHAARSSMLKALDLALDQLREIRAGMYGVIPVCRMPLDDEDHLLRPSRCWESETPYVCTRHARLKDASEALRAEVLAQCQIHHGLIPEVEVLRIQTVPGQGLSGSIRLRFPRAVKGPIALGRTALLGGGLFKSVS